MEKNNKILLVTGKRAKESVKKYAAQTETETDIIVLPVSIASFMNLKIFVNNLKKKNLEKFTAILTPGMAEFDLEAAEEELGVPVFKGSKHAADLPFVLDNLKGFEFCKDVPACELLEDEFSDRVEDLLLEIREGVGEDLGSSGNFRVGDEECSVLAGLGFPPRVVGEIVDAPRLSDDEFLEVARGYVERGAEVLDIGMTTEGGMGEEIPRLVSLLRENFEVPISIDSTDKDEIEIAIENGIDLIVSIDGSMIESFEGLEVPAVLIPRNSEEGYYPTDPGEKVSYLDDLLEKAEKFGFERPIADPILGPVGRGFVTSLSAFRELKGKREDVSLFMGIGNAIELFDADSIGMTSILVGAASELNVDFVLSVEASDKTQNNIQEVTHARNMMILANERDTVPKDLGIDLLRYKEKRKRTDPYEKEIEQNAKIIQASPSENPQRDEKGFFKIFTEEGKIVAVFHNFEGENVVIKGETAGEVAGEIMERSLVSEFSHAAYLGRELQKAEIAIRTGRGYIQEEDVF